jgi:hypothetical protein
MDFIENIKFIHILYYTFFVMYTVIVWLITYKVFNTIINSSTSENSLDRFMNIWIIVTIILWFLTFLLY